MEGRGIRGEEGTGIKEGEGGDRALLFGNGVERGGKERKGRDGNKGRGGRGQGATSRKAGGKERAERKGKEECGTNLYS